MLTTRMQVQYIADRLAGLPVEVDARLFSQPWQACWNAIISSTAGNEQAALYKVTATLSDQKEILQAILATRPGFVPLIPSLKDIASNLPPIDWVWKGWIPRGLITVLGASQGSGKSFVSMDLAYRIIHNIGFPDGSSIARPGANVIYVDAEAVPQILRERADHYGMDQNKIFMLLANQGEMIDLGQQKYQDRLTEMTAALQPELIIIDSLSSIHSRGQNNVEDLRALVGYIIRLAGWANCGLILVHHIRKPPGGGQRMMNVDIGMEDLSGSGYITQQARVVLGLRVVQTGPEFDPNGPREVKMLKNNLGAYPKPLGFSFAPINPEGVMIKWDDHAPKSYREPTQSDLCREWLIELLQTTSSGVKVKEVLEIGYEQGFSRPTIFRTRRDLQAHIRNTEGRKSPKNSWKWFETPLDNDEDFQDEE